MSAIRILFLADTHLGFDLPVQPRISRRRRGHDFFANFDRALEAAVARDVDYIVHGGDLFFRSRVPASLVHMAFRPLKRVADAGVPVFLVPGNHERSRIPYQMLALHPRIHIFDRPRTFVEQVRGVRVAFTGFPYYRDGVRDKFRELLESSSWQDAGADVNLLCVHQCFEGAKVGPVNFTFRFASDVVRVEDVPADFAAVLSGHIHRHQILATNLGGDPLPTPILFPGSIERTSFAEKDEPKGFLVLEIKRGDAVGGCLERSEFCRLPARPMVVTNLQADGADPLSLESHVSHAISRAPPNAVLRLRIHGKPRASARRVISASNLRGMAPPTMNVDAVLVDERR